MLARGPSLASVEDARRKSIQAGMLLEERARVRLRLALRFLVLAIVFEGALRKWIFPGGADVLYFLKDAAIALVYVTAAFSPPGISAGVPTRATRLTAVAFVALGFLVALSAISPAHPDDRVALLGVRAYLYYPPLLLVVPKAYTRREDLVRDAFGLAWILVGLGALVLIQVVAPASSFINRYARNLSNDPIATAGAAVRATATFSYIWPFVDFIVFAGAVVTPLFFVATTQGRRVAAALGTIAAVVCALATGSRAAGLLVAFTLCAPTAIALRRGMPGARRLFQLALVFALALSISGAVKKSAEGLGERTVSSRDSFGRVLLFLLDYTPVLGISYAFTSDVPFLGDGVGICQHSAQRFLPHRPELFQEFEGPIVVQELGIPGFLAYYTFRVGIVALVVGIARRARSNLDAVVCGSAAIVLAVAFPRTCVTDSLNFLLTCLLASTALAFARSRDGASPFAPVARTAR